MWISKKRYKTLIQKKDEIKAHSDYIEAQFNALTEKNSTWYNDILIIHKNAWHELMSPQEKLAKELEEARSELNMWKQKYADEVQKRLALINQLSNA